MALWLDLEAHDALPSVFQFLTHSELLALGTSATLLYDLGDPYSERPFSYDYSHGYYDAFLVRPTPAHMVRSTRLVMYDDGLALAPVRTRGRGNFLVPAPVEIHTRRSWCAVS